MGSKLFADVEDDAAWVVDVVFVAENNVLTPASCCSLFGSFRLRLISLGLESRIFQSEQTDIQEDSLLELT